MYFCKMVTLWQIYNIIISEKYITLHFGILMLLITQCLSVWQLYVKRSKLTANKTEY